MKAPADEFATALERLTEKVEELEARLSNLERRSEATGPWPTGPLIPTAVPPHPLDALSLPHPASALAAVGKLFVGMAGAYLLRALSESGIVPQSAVVAVALAYAVAWLVWAARVRAGAGFVSAAYAITAALILSPMLWELTVRFHILPAWVTACVLAAFVVLASALAWKRNLASLVGAANLAAAITGLALVVATRDPAPFTLTFLVMALTAEVAACRDHWLGWRAIAAVASDFAVLVLILVYTPHGGPPVEYRPVAAAMLPALVSAGFVLYVSSTVLRTVVLRRRISVFETGQVAVAFLLAVVGILRVSPAAAPALGAFCLLAAALSYVAAFARFAGTPLPRNYHVFATWAAALWLAGSFLLLPQAMRAPWLTLVAVTTTFMSIRSGLATLGFHGAVYLAIAAFVSGLWESAGHVLAGAFPPMPGWTAGIAAAGAVVCYVIAAHSLPEEDALRQRLLRLVFGVPAAYVTTALAVVLMAWLASPAAAISASRVAALRTLAVCVVALALAFAGSRWKRVELMWLAYAAIAFCTLKLLFEDLPHGSAASIAASLFFYGMVWVLVPRLMRRSPR